MRSWDVTSQAMSLTCSPEVVSMASPGSSSSSISRSLLLTSCWSLRACRSAAAVDIESKHDHSCYSTLNVKY